MNHRWGEWDSIQNHTLEMIRMTNLNFEVPCFPSNRMWLANMWVEIDTRWVWMTFSIREHENDIFLDIFKYLIHENEFRSRKHYRFFVK